MLEINILCLPLHIRYNPECEDQRENLQIIDKIMIYNNIHCMSNKGHVIIWTVYTDRQVYIQSTNYETNNSNKSLNIHIRTESVV